MRGTWIGLVLGLLTTVSVRGQDLEVFGYFEPQYMGLRHQDDYYQLNTNKLRVDLGSTAAEKTEFGADFIYILPFGKSDWNILDFLPERITSEISEEMYPHYQFTYRDTFYLDNVYVRLANSRYAVVVGKQQISLGTGYFSNPTDVFNVKDALDPTYEQPGHNAIRMDFLLGHRLQVMGLYAPIERDWVHSGKLVRVKAGLGHFDFSLLGNEMQHITTDFYTFQLTQERRRLLGVDFVGEVMGFGVWGEGGYSFLEDSDDFHEFIVGLDYTFESGLYAMMEYHRNSLAKSDHTEYDLNDWMRLFTGETKTIARDQIYGFARYSLTDLLTIGASTIVSATDGSAAFVPTVDYSLFENIDLTFMGNVYVGEEGKTFSSSLGNGGFLRAQVYF